MNEELDKIAVLADEAEMAAKGFRSLLGDTPVQKDLRAAFEILFTNLNALSESLSSGDIQAVLNYARTAGIYGEAVGHESSKLKNNSFTSAGKELLEKSIKLRGAAETSPMGLEPLLKIEAANQGGASKRVNITNNDHNEKLKIFIDEQERHDQRVKKLLNENELRITTLSKRIDELERAAQTEIDKITSTYSDSLREIGAKKSEIDDILGHVSGRAIAGDYEKSAAEEKKMANWLRFWSLACMAVIAGGLIYTLVGHANDWQESLFRVSLTFLLSVPAAYLARESAKHREQQYQHLQTSLDLKALSPFVASLPDDEQHKIKIAIASKIFAGRDFSKIGADPFPINTQEIIMELLKRVDVPKAKS